MIYTDNFSNRVLWFSIESFVVFRSNSELPDPFEVLFDDISLHKIIGEGCFGKVYRGELLKQIMEVRKGRKTPTLKTRKKEQQKKIGLTVAVKMLQSKIFYVSFA